MKLSALRQSQKMIKHILWYGSVRIVIEQQGERNEISFLSLELVFIGIWFLIRIFVWIRQGYVNWKHEAAQLLMYINLAVIIRFVFFPRALADGHIQPLVFDSANAFPFRVNIVPMVHLFE